MTAAERSFATWLAILIGALALAFSARAAEVRSHADQRPRTTPPKFETVAPLSQEHGSVDWSPSPDLGQPAVAAYAENGRPLVLYSARLLAGHPRPIAKFLALRQEVVVLVLEGARKQRLGLQSVERGDGAHPPTGAGSTRLVPEAMVYPLVARYGAFGNVSQTAFGPHVLDCIALLFMTPDERQTVAFYAGENSRFFAHAFDPPHDLLEHGRALTDCPALDPRYDAARARRSFLSDWDAGASR